MKCSPECTESPIVTIVITASALLLLGLVTLTTTGCDEFLEPSTDTDCCIENAGCPSETGTSCPGTCCCCPDGMRCDQSNPSRGCVPVEQSEGGSNGSCGSAGAQCNVNGDCCSGHYCVNNATGDGVARCSASCSVNSDCQSYCCCALESGAGACCPSSNC